MRKLLICIAVLAVLLSGCAGRKPHQGYFLLPPGAIIGHPGGVLWVNDEGETMGGQAFQLSGPMAVIDGRLLMELAREGRVTPIPDFVMNPYQTERNGENERQQEEKEAPEVEGGPYRPGNSP